MRNWLEWDYGNIYMHILTMPYFYLKLTQTNFYAIKI